MDKSFRFNIFASYFGQGWSALMAIAFVPIYIRVLGLEAYGLVGVLMFMQTWFTPLDLGITPTINREMARYAVGERSAQSTRNLFRTIELIALVIAILISAVVWYSAEWISNEWLRADRLQKNEISAAISIIGVLVAMRFVEGIYRGAILGLQKHVWLNLAVATSSTFRWAGAAFIILFIEPSLDIFFAWQALVSLLTIISFWWRINSFFPQERKSAVFSKLELLGVWKFAGGTMLATILSVFLTQADKIILSKLSGLEVFGYYSAAWTFAAVLYQLIIPITQTYFPRFTGLISLNDQIRSIDVYHQAAQILTWVTVPLAFLLIFFGDSILMIWTKSPDLVVRSAPLLAIFSVGVLLNGFLHVPHIFSLAAGWTKFSVLSNTISLMFFIPILFFSIKTWGANGAAISWVLLNVGGFFLGMQFFYQRLLMGEKWSWYLKDIGIPFFMAFSIVLIIRLLTQNKFFCIYEIIFIYILIVLGVTVTIPVMRRSILRVFLKDKRHA